MVAPIKLEIDGVEVTGVEWELDTEEVLGGAGRFNIRVQDRNNSYVPPDHGDVRVSIRSEDWTLARGEIISTSCDLELKHPWRVWKIDGSDYNASLTERKVGAFDGKTWIDAYGLGIYVNIDPFAASLETDKLTVQQLFDHYVRVADGLSVETTTYVNQYISDLFQIDWEYTDVQTALEELAANVVENLQFWIDPDLFFHWVVIPAWYDLLQEAVGVSLDEGESVSAMGFPEGSIEGLPVAPVEIVDVRDQDDGETIGFSELSFEYDGSEMPEQVYVRGSTGYVYNSPPIPPTEDTKTVVSSPTPGVDATYEATILQANTKLWHVDGTGYTSIFYDLAGPGGPWPVKWVRVPWNEDRHKGGNYWKFLSGPHAGKMLDDNTNYLSGYGGMVVHRVTESPGDPDDPKIGVGGSGWSGEVTQDPNKRQAYLEAPVSSTRSRRDAMGGQALYRGSISTVRGSVKVRGLDGWRVGQVVKISDARMPADLVGRYFVIQKVQTSPLHSTDIRVYRIDWGDGPESRYSGDKVGGDAGMPPPAIQIDVQAFDLSPGPDSTQTITGQMVNGSGQPWNVAGKVVNWSVECYNNLGVLQPGVGEVNPTQSSTDNHGRARTRLTTGPGTNLVYFVFAAVKAT